MFLAVASRTLSLALLATPLSLCLITTPAAAGELQTLTLPADLPEHFETSLRLEEQPLTLRLQQRSVRSAEFEVFVFTAQGTIESAETGPVRTYQGWVLEEPGSQVAASLYTEGMRAVIHRPDGSIWEIDHEGLDGPLHRAELRPPAELDLACPIESGPEEAFRAALRPDGSDDCGVVQAELALDCSYSCFERKNLDIAEVEAMFEETINELNIIYVRDIRVEYLLGRTVIRTTPESDPYFGLEFFDKLDVVRDEWNSGVWGEEHDQAALVDGDGDGSGLAWVGTVCSASRYSINGFSGLLPVVVMRHELGHNWGAGHYEGGSPEGPTIMSGNSIPRFSGPEKDKMMPHRDSRTCLDDLGPYPTPIPPYAHFDDHLAARCSTLPMAVLSNDEDANCQDLEIVDFDRVTPLGGSVSLAGDSLIYAAPYELGTDNFTYTIQDSDGLTAIGNIRVEVEDPSLLLSQERLSVHYVDSEQEGYAGTMAIDGDPQTHWHTRWSPRTDPYPHEFQIDLGTPHRVNGLRYLPRQDGSPNGHIAIYRVLTSLDGSNWGQAVATGIWTYSPDLKTVSFSPRVARFVSLRGLSEVNDKSWASAAEISVLGEELWLNHSPLERGAPATLMARGAEPGERVFFVVGLAGPGCGPCPPGLGGLCLDLLEPVQLLGSALVDAEWLATLEGVVPEMAPGTLAFQAVVRRGVGGMESVKSGAVEAEVGG